MNVDSQDFALVVDLTLKMFFMLLVFFSFGLGVRHPNGLLMHGNECLAP